MLPKLLAAFAEDLIAETDSLSSEVGYFTHDSVPLKWHFPVGLLYDIYVLSTQDFSPGSSGINGQTFQPFKLHVHFASPSSELHLNLVSPSASVVHDSFINSVKEADFLRSGTAKPIMSLSAADSKALWSSTQDNDLSIFSRIHGSLLPPKGQMRNVPIRVFLPSSPAEDGNSDAVEAENNPILKAGQIKVLQAQISPFAANPNQMSTSQLRAPNAVAGPVQTVGTALHSVMPSLFPSRRTPILAKPILHGAPLPMGAGLEDLARKACYADGWVNVVVSMAN